MRATLPPEDAREIDRICDQFERAWRSGSFPRIETYLPTAAPHQRSELLRDLLAIELEYRLRDGERPLFVDYVRRFPDDPPAVAAAFAKQKTPPPQAAPPPPPPARDFPQVEGYRVERLLGQGGMGTVYLAVRSADGCRVALKTIKPAMAVEPKSVQRFLREAHILRQLAHPHIVRLHDVGESQGLLFFAMEYVEGTDAARLLKQKGPLPVRTAVRVLCQALKPLAFAHAQGFVHRDLKPANLLLAGKGQKRSVKLADFGLARLYQESPLSGLTMQGEVGGTLGYMPPEQITHFRDVQPAADQYSAAATLYQLLTGRLVYDEPETSEEWFGLILHHDPVPIQARRADVPEALAAILHRALARRPEERFADVTALRDALLPCRE